MKATIRVLLVLTSAVFLSLSCKQSGLESLKKDTLFTLSIGKGEDELAFFQNSDDSAQKLSLAMADGLFYISSAQGAKVMKLNSYGDLLELYYNSKKNPEPVLLSNQLQSGQVANRRAFPYDFQEIGNIAVTGDLTMLVQDQIPQDRQEFDNDLGVMLDQIVLRFDRTGKLIDYLGQEGSGGTPFPYIEKLQVTENGDNVVFCRTPDRWLIFWFTKDGYIRYKVNLSLRALPGIDGKDYIPSLETIFADYKKPQLYVKIDYYKDTSDEGSQAESGIKYMDSYVHVFDLDGEKYIRKIEIPTHYLSQNTLDFISVDKEIMLYEFIGVSKNGYMFFVSPTDGSFYELMILDSEGKMVKRVKISIQDADTLYRVFYLTPDGILTSLICGNYSANVVWWRSDKFLEQGE